MSILKKLFDYILLRKDEEFGDNTYIKWMHGINKISILIFLVAIIVILVRYL